MVKIIKKHDKINPTHRSLRSALVVLRASCHFVSSRSLLAIKEKHQELYGRVFCGESSFFFFFFPHSSGVPSSNQTKSNQATTHQS